MLLTLFKYRKYGDVWVFYKNSFNCFILVILRNIRDTGMKWFLGNFLVVQKSPNIFITKSYSCKKSSSTGKVDKETMKSKISVVDGKNKQAYSFSQNIWC